MAFLALLPLAFLAGKRPAARCLLIFGLVLWLPMNLLSGLARFSIPALVPLSLGLALLLADLEGWAPQVAMAGVLTLSCVNLLYVHSKTDAMLWRVLRGDIPIETFLSHRRPTYPVPPFAAYQWVDQHAPGEARILLVGEPRSFYLKRDSETSSPYAAQPLADYANVSSSGEDMYRRLRAAGITHIVFNVAGMSLSKQTMRMSAEGLAALRSFWANSLEAVFVDKANEGSDVRFTVVYRLLSEAEIQKPHPPVQVPFGSGR